MHISYQNYVEHSKLAFKNKALLEKSKAAACYYCYAKCDTKDIEYTDDETGIQESKNRLSYDIINFNV